MRTLSLRQAESVLEILPIWSARALMAAAVTVAALLTTALPLILLVDLSAGHAALTARTLVGTLAPIALAWALFGFSIVVFLAVRRDGGGATRRPGSRARP